MPSKIPSAVPCPPQPSSRTPTARSAPLQPVVQICLKPKKKPAAAPSRRRPDIDSKTARAAARVRAHRHKINPDPETGLTFLEEHRVTEVTSKDYQRRFSLFMAWAMASGYATTTIAQLQIALLMYMEVLFFDGELIHEGLRLIAAVDFLRDDVLKGASNLPRVLSASKGWRRLSPSQSRLPVPWPVVCLMASIMMARGWVCEARRTVMMFILYVRPSEALRLQVGDIVPPQPSLRGPSGRKWSVVLNPFERGAASKTGEFDESLVLDNNEFAFFDAILQAATQGRPAGAPLFAGTYADWAARFATAGRLAQLEALGPPVLYQLRHGGASHELLSGARDVPGIKKRGRWVTDTSLRRYEKGGRVAQQMAKLPIPVRQACVRAAALIAGILSGACAPVMVP